MSPSPTSSTRRERKKAATRRRLAEAALNLFLERGFDQVTVAEIAEAADVAVSTLFAHFPSKEALVFDRGEERQRALVAAVRERPAGSSILDALFTHLASPPPAPHDLSRVQEFRALVNATPALSDYFARLQRQLEASLAQAIAEAAALPADDVAAASLARYALEGVVLANAAPDPHAALESIFERLRRGWSDLP